MLAAAIELPRMDGVAFRQYIKRLLVAPETHDRCV